MSGTMSAKERHRVRIQERQDNLSMFKKTLSVLVTEPKPQTPNPKPSTISVFDMLHKIDTELSKNAPLVSFRAKGQMDRRVG